MYIYIYICVYISLSLSLSLYIYIYMYIYPLDVQRRVVVEGARDLVRCHHRRIVRDLLL